MVEAAVQGFRFGVPIVFRRVCRGPYYVPGGAIAQNFARVDRFFVAHAVSRQVSRHPLADKPTGSLRIGVKQRFCSWHLFDPAF